MKSNLIDEQELLERIEQARQAFWAPYSDSQELYDRAKLILDLCDEYNKMSGSKGTVITNGKVC